MSNIIQLTPAYDRSRVVQDWKCPRSRYLNYELGGTGISPTNMPLALFTGITIHDALATLAIMTKAGKDIDIDALAAATREQLFKGIVEGSEWDQTVIHFANEQAALVEGLLRGFYMTVWPRLLANYPRILFVEEEMKYEHGGLVFMSKPDLILANDDETVYVEYKSTSSKKEEWINSWDTAIQLHSTMKAVEATHGVKVDSVIVQGLYKGYSSYGKQNSPFCYGYKRAGNPPFSKDEISHEYKPGFKKTPTWELPGGVSAWVKEMPLETLAEQFPQTAPIAIKEKMVNRFFLQCEEREWEIAESMSRIFKSESDGEIEEELNKYFPQRFDQCQPGWGSPCQYKRICHGHVQNPLDEGFSPREPHHAYELEKAKSLEN